MQPSACSKSAFQINENEVCNFHVECRVCNCFYSWSELVDGDGCCLSCLNEHVTAVDGNTSHTAFGDIRDLGNSAYQCPGEEMSAECVSASRSLLSLGDGHCSASEQTDMLDAHVDAEMHPQAASSRGRWQRHKCHA